MADEDSGVGQRRLVVGLGNPGQRYSGTRHNLGFRVVGELAGMLEAGDMRLECNSLVATRDTVFLARPQTFMNRSGFAVRCLAEKHGFEPEDVLVVYDDTALPLGTLRMRARGGPGGHRGMESVIHNLRTEALARLRLGIARANGLEEGTDLSAFVLEEFEADEEDLVERMIVRAAEACRSWLVDGVEATMSRFNG